MAEINRVESRQSNIELLRIVCIVMIIAFHAVFHGDWSGIEGMGASGVFNPDSLTLSVVMIQSILPLGIVAVNTFVLITGYFLSESVTLKVGKTVKLWLQMLFYSVSITLVLSLYRNEPLTVMDYIMMSAPVIAGTWWYASAYIVLLILSPFLNMILKQSNTTILFAVISFLTVIWFVAPTFTNMSGYGNDLLCFIDVYMIGGMIRQHRNKLLGTPSIPLFAFITIYSLLMATIIFYDYHDPIVFYHNPVYNSVFRNSIFTLILSILLFIFFLNYNIGCKKCINIIASGTFGVYLLHEHPMVHDLLYSSIDTASINLWTEATTWIIALTAVQYLLFLMIELVRKWAIDYHLLKTIDNRFDIPVQCREDLQE